MDEDSFSITAARRYTAAAPLIIELRRHPAVDADSWTPPILGARK